MMTRNTLVKARQFLASPWTPLGCFGAWLLGQLARDASWLTGMVFYVPSLVVALAVLDGAQRLLPRRRGLATVLAVLALPPLWVTAGVENRWRPPGGPEAPGSFGLVHWNVFNARLGWDRVRRQLADFEADVYVISEVPPGVSEAHLAAALGDGYQAVLRLGMAAVGRGTLDRVEVVARGTLRIVQVRWRWRGEELRLFLVDSASDLFMPRDPNLRRLARWMTRRQPDLVVGDFNAPRRSRALWPPPRGFTHAYEASGSGWSYTWPSILPLLAIDQCLVGQRIEPRRYELRTSWLSDHRLQRLKFDVVGGSSSGPSPSPPE